MTTESESAAQPLEAAPPAIGAFVRTVAIGALAGFVAGVIAGGAGSRLAMRISAIAAGDRFQGSLTEAEARVGEITAEGTIFLLIFGGIIGVFGGLVYLGVRRWVADAGRWKGLAFGVLLLAMFGWAIIEGDNPDFHLFGPPALNIATFASLFILFGLLVAPLFDWIERALPSPSLGKRFGVIRLPSDYSPAGLGSLAAQAFGLLLTLQIVLLVAFGFGEEESERLKFRILPGYVLLVVPIAAVLLARASGRFERLSDLRWHGGAMAVAFAVLALPVFIGLVLNVQAIADIFEANR